MIFLNGRMLFFNLNFQIDENYVMLNLQGDGSFNDRKSSVKN